MNLTKDWYSSLSPEKLEKEKERRRKKYNAVTPEEKLIRSQKRKERERKKMEKWTPEQWKIHRENLRKRWQKYYERLTSEEKEFLHQKILVKKREDWHSLSDEEKEEDLKRLEEWAKYNPRTILSPEEKKKRLQQMVEYGRRKRQELRLTVLSHYSNGKPICVKCGFTDIRALCIDHINGGGRRHAQSLGGHVYSWIIKNNFPKDMFQVLCQNCNIIKKIENKEDYVSRKKQKEEQ